MLLHSFSLIRSDCHDDTTRKRSKRSHDKFTVETTKQSSVKIWLSSISELVNLSQARKWPKGRTEGLNIPVDNGYTLYDSRTLSHTFAATSLEARPQPLQQSAQNSQMTATSPLFFALTSNLEPTIENQICCPNQSHKISCSDSAPLRFSHADNFQSGHTWSFHFFSSHRKAFLIPSCLWVSARCRW